MNRTYDRTQTDAVAHALQTIGPMTCLELSVLLVRSVHGIRDSLRRLDGQIHIARYQPPANRGRRAPVYAWGPGEDAVEGANSVRERNRKYRIRHRAIIAARNVRRRGGSRSIWAGLM